MLKGVITQQLIPRARGGGRINVSEVLVCTPAVSAVIREGKTHQIYTLMQAGQKFGMQTMNQALFAAYIQKKITLENALGRSSEHAGTRADDPEVGSELPAAERQSDLALGRRAVPVFAYKGKTTSGEPQAGELTFAPGMKPSAIFGKKRIIASYIREKPKPVQLLA